jgi:hypothetical protein
MKPSKDVIRLEEALDNAENMFWSAIAIDYPDAHTGDLDPELAIDLAIAMRKAVTSWLEVNADPKEPEKKNVTVLLHNVEYSYVDGKDITDSDLETVAYNISQGISSGELYDTEFVSRSTAEAYGSWEINNK